MKNKLVFAGLLIAVLTIGFSVIGCVSTGGSSASTPKPKSETVMFQPADDGWVRFFNNVRSVSGDRKTTFANPNADPNVYEMDVKKNSGYDGAAFGMMFASKDNSNCYVACFYVDGTLRIRKFINNKMEDITDKIKLPEINAGYGAVNAVKAVKNGNNYDVYVNGGATPVYTMTDTSIQGNQIGYCVFVGNSQYEKYPENPVEVLFKVK